MREGVAKIQNMKSYRTYLLMRIKKKKYWTRQHRMEKEGTAKEEGGLLIKAET